MICSAAQYVVARDEVRATDPFDDEAVLKWLLLAYPDRVVKRRGAERTGVMVGGRGVRLGPESVVRDADLYLALDAREDRRASGLEVQVRLASSIELDVARGTVSRRAAARATDALRRSPTPSGEFEPPLVPRLVTAGGPVGGR